MYHINKEITRNGENLTLKNTAKHYYKKFDILGASKQETRSGKNLCKLDDKTETSNGITSVITNGVVSVKGTATSTWFNLTTNQSFTLKAGTYTVSVNKTLTQFGIDFYDSSATVFSLAKNLTSAKFTLSSEKTITRFVGVVANGEVLNIDGLTFQIEEGSVATEHEQYGAMPSIEYESPIESVGDNIQLFDGEIEVGGINDDGTFNNLTDRRRMANYLDVKEINEITMRFYDMTYTSVMGRYLLYDENYSVIDTQQILSLTTTIDTSSASYVKFWILNVSVPLEAKIKIIKGTKATPYSPYGQGSVEIKQQNSNLFDISQINGFVNCSVNNKVITSSALTGNFQYVRFNFNSISLKAKEIYTISMKMKIDSGTYSDIINSVQCFNDGTMILDSVKIKNPTITNDYQEYEFRITPSEDITLNRLLIQLRQNAKQVIISIIDIQIEKGETVTNYIEHQSQTKALYTQQPFRAIGDVKDRFVRVNGANKEQHSIARKIFNGTENWGIARTTDNITIYQCLLNDSNYDDLSKNLLSNMFESYTPSELWYSTTNGIAINSYKYVQIAITSIINSIDNFKSWLAEQYANGTPLYVDYVLAKPTLIECTPEQVEQLEEIEKEMYSYDEVTNIYSTDKISPYFDVIAYQRISEEFKTRLKEGKITRGYLKVLATDTLPEIIIDENNYLKDLKIEELRYVPEEGFIGGAVAKRVSGNFNNVDNSFDIQDREVEVYLGVELEDETTEYIKYGTYIVQRPEDDQVNDNTSFEALDYMVKFNQEYKDRITYPCTLKELLNDVLDQAGVNSKTNTFANSDFIVENNQFEQGTTLRDVIKAIAQVAFNWARIDEDDNFVMDFEMNENIDEELGTDDYFGFKKTDNYGPVNVIVLRNSQVEGENITIKDENLINSPKGYNLLNMKNAKGGTHTGITCTTNEDGTYNYVGTAGSTTINVWLLGGYQVQAPILITLEPRKILHARL